MVWARIANAIGDNIRQLIDRKDGLYCFRLQKDRCESLSYVEDLMKLAAVIGRDNLRSFGTCLGKFTKGKKFYLHVTALVYLAPYAKYKLWLKPNAEQQFLYGHHVLKSGIARMADDCPRNIGALVFSLNDIPLVSADQISNLLISPFVVQCRLRPHSYVCW
ncbi:unnamed protein product, partial [Soboliphyme baturini]|uniref:60S ribosome subunit biogenesis protein NIP7 homolog n=1 Tax=Soboliphyme baturini TaxID=241478 RepID=A0A183J4S7_9BILA